MRRPLLFALVLFCAPAPLRLSAQIRMPRPKVPNPLDRVTQAASPSRNPAYDDRVLEITDARITALVRGLEAEKRQRPALTTGYRQNADARAADAVARRGEEGRMEQVNTCLTNSPEYRRAMSDTVGQAAMMARIQALQAKGDYTAMAAVGDSMSRAAMKRDSALTAARTRCEAIPRVKVPTGPPPPTPAHPLADSLKILGAGVAGLTADQYAVMRERVLAYLATDEAELHNSMYAFSGGELGVLRARKNDLQRYQSTLAEE